MILTIWICMFSNGACAHARASISSSF